MEDPAVSSWSETVVQYLLRNYEPNDISANLKFIDDFAIKLKVRPRLVSKELFNEDTRREALFGLAFFNGFLTFANPNSTGTEENVLITPNELTRSLYITAMGKEEGDLKMFLGIVTEVVAKYTGVDKEMISSGQLKATLQKTALAVATKDMVTDTHLHTHLHTTLKHTHSHTHSHTLTHNTYTHTYIQH